MIFARRHLSVCVASGACLAADKAGLYPSEIKRYADEATENNVFRLTDPAHQSWLPAPYSRAISKKSEFLIHCERPLRVGAGVSAGFEERAIAGVD